MGKRITCPLYLRLDDFIFRAWCCMCACVCACVYVGAIHLPFLLTALLPCSSPLPHSSVAIVVGEGIGEEDFAPALGTRHKRCLHVLVPRRGQGSGAHARTHKSTNIHAPTHTSTNTCARTHSRTRHDTIKNTHKHTGRRKHRRHDGISSRNGRQRAEQAAHAFRSQVVNTPVIVHVRSSKPGTPQLSREEGERGRAGWLALSRARTLRTFSRDNSPCRLTLKKRE